jgi:protein ImuA
MFLFPRCFRAEQMDLTIPPSPPAMLDSLRARIARIERASMHPEQGVLSLEPALDAVLPGGGLALGALHQVAGAGPDTDHGAAAALFIAGILARHSGPVLWVVGQADLFAPGLAAAGLQPERVIYAEAGKADAVLQAMEEGLRQPGMGGVVGEVGGLTLTASRRLQLAAESTGTPAFALRRSRKHDDPALAAPSAAVTTWRIAAIPSPPPLPQAPDTPGLARQRWQLDLVRCRGGKSSSWIVEACDAEGRLGLVADIADGSAAPAWRRSA